MREQITPNKKIRIGLILSWVFGVLFILTGIISVFPESKPGLVMLIMAHVLLLPSVVKLIELKSSFNMTRTFKAVIVTVGLIIFNANIDISTTQQDDQKVTEADQQNIVNNEEQSQIETNGQVVNYEGEWTVSGDSFENKLVLKKVNINENIYNFSFVGWRKSYDIFTDQVINFSGEMSGNRFEIQIIDNIGYYTDDTYVDDNEEFPLYNEGEERCKLLFEFDKETITVKTTACSLIYAGYGVSFDGVYKKIK